jgi:8-oxo-dGTP diphosphatase
MLLIRKKRGLGAGKINGPGGRMDPGETALECAIREVEEELRVKPVDPQLRGELSFQFLDGYSIHAYVFVATDCRGEAQETDEAIPLWTPLDRIPYEQMWADDRLWIPRMLAGGYFAGRFVFDGDHMLDHLVRDLDEPPDATGPE